jgi:hypothetical protein
MGTDLSLLRSAGGAKRFEWRSGNLYQRSAVDPGIEWRVKLVKDSVDPASPDYRLLRRLVRSRSRRRPGPGAGGRAPARRARRSRRLRRPADGKRLVIIKTLHRRRACYTF